MGAGAAKDPTLFDWTAFNQQQRAEAAKWASSDPVARVAVNLQVVNSLLQLTYDFLELDSARWDQQQRARAAGEDTRDYPLLSVARGTHVGQCVSGLLEMLTHPPRGVPFLKQTRSTRAFYFVTLSAALCAVQVQLHMRHAACPIALFRADAESSQAFHQLPPCMHDEFARALHKMYPTQPAKSSSECAAVLAACAALASTDIGSVEASHASNRDVAKLRASGWTPTLAFVAGKFVLRKTKLSKERTAGFQHKHFLSKDAKCRAARRRRQRRPGGAWRAFVHEQQRLHRPGAKFDPDFLRQLGVQYRALPAAEKLRLQQVGFLANAAGRHGFQPFGPSQRQAQPPPLQVGDVTEAGAIVAPPPVTVEDVQVGGRTFEELLLREQQQWPARRDRQQEQRREVDLLVKHADRSELQKEVCAALKGHGVDTVLTELFEAVPGRPPLQELRWRPPAEILDEKVACSTADPQHGSRGVRGRIQEHWARMHRVISPDTVPPFPVNADAVFRPSQCFRLQVCVCGRSSRSFPHIPLWRQRLQKIMAKAFPGTQKDMSHSLALLRKGLVVLCFRKQQHEAQAAWQSQALDSILCEDVATAGPAALYMHVGYVNFRTWDMSVLQLEEVSSENEDGLRELSAGLPGAPPEERPDCASALVHAHRLSCSLHGQLLGSGSRCSQAPQHGPHARAPLWRSRSTTKQRTLRSGKAQPAKLQTRQRRGPLQTDMLRPPDEPRLSAVRMQTVRAKADVCLREWRFRGRARALARAGARI